MESTELIKRMTDTHSRCQSYEDVGTIAEVEIEGRETNTSRVRFRVQFVRSRAFRLELHSERQHGIGPYSLVYYWDGARWSVFNSINSHYGSNPVITNADDSEVVGGGVALSYDLVPFTPRLLCLSEDFCGFRGADGGKFSINGIPQTKSAKVSIERLRLRQVYRLTLLRDVAMYHDVEDYWIDPHTYTIIKRRSQYAKDRGNHTDFTTRESTHRPKLGTLTDGSLIEFSPPHSRATKSLERMPVGHVSCEFGRLRPPASLSSR